MATLDRIMQMQQQGISDIEISTQLQNEGVNPAEISDSLNQAKIKNAVSPPENGQQEQQAPTEMQASVMPGQTAQQPIPQEGQPQDDYYQATPQAYQEQNYYAPQGTADTETISEIAEQVATEKLEEYKKKTGDMASFKNTIQDKVDDIDDRLKKIESNIDKLQQAIIGKIGEFGESNAIIHKDLDNLHGTVSKLMDPLIDNYNELKKTSK
jgi:hypothetical protein